MQRRQPSDRKCVADRFLCKPELPQTSRRYLAKFPDAEPITALGDFAFFRLEITGGRLVSGFGGAINLTARSLPSLLAIGRPS